MRKSQGINLIKLRNPWGNHEWLGAYSDCSDLWTDTMKRELHYVDADDGTFWMSFEDFQKYYTDIDVARSKGKVGQLKGAETKLTADEKTSETFIVEAPQPIEVQFNTEIIGADDVRYAIKVVDGAKSGGTIMKTNQTIFSLTTQKLKFTSTKYVINVYSQQPVPAGTTVFVRVVSESDFTMTVNGKEIKENPELDVPEITEMDEDGDGIPDLKQVITKSIGDKL